MRTFIKNFMLPLLFGGNFPEGKIDPNLLKKTRTLGCGPISAVIFSKEKEGCLCKQYLESLGAKIKYELPLINAYAVVLQFYAASFIWRKFPRRQDRPESS